MFYNTGKIINPGRGYFVDRTFSSLAEAQAFCRAEVTKNRRAILNLMRDDHVLETFSDAEGQRQQRFRNAILPVLLSTIPVGLSAALLVKKAVFLPPSAHLPVTAAMVLIYLFILLCHNWGIFEAYVAMALVFFLALMLIPALNKAHARREKRKTPTASLTVYAVRWPNPAAPGNRAITLQCHAGRPRRAVPEQQCYA